MAEIQSRTCLKCRQQKTPEHFQYTPSPFFPAHRSLICTSCLEQMARPDDLDAIDALMRHLDLPFDLDLWTQLYETHGPHTLSFYFNMLADQHYQSTSWRAENDRWLQARNSGTIQEEIKALSKARVAELQKKWSSQYSMEELLWLDDFYNRVTATQNVSTPILQEYARDYCEIQLRIKKGLRAGLDVKKDMDARDNIIKNANFTASNSKNAADFDSVGELITYFVKLGWQPNFHTEPQDSIDFIMRDNQTYLRRLVQGEGNFADQVEDARAKYNLAERMEEDENSYNYDVQDAVTSFEDEEEEGLEDDISGLQ